MIAVTTGIAKAVAEKLHAAFPRRMIIEKPIVSPAKGLRERDSRCSSWRPIGLTKRPSSALEAAWTRFAG
jgi:hypothetical protein